MVRSGIGTGSPPRYLTSLRFASSSSGGSTRTTRVTRLSDHTTIKEISHPRKDERLKYLDCSARWDDDSVSRRIVDLDPFDIVPATKADISHTN